MGREYLGVSQDGSGDPQVGPGRVGGLSGKFGTDRGMLEEVWDGLGNLGEVQEASQDPRGGAELVV